MKKTIAAFSTLILITNTSFAKDTYEYFIPEHPTPGSSLMIPSENGSPTIIVSAGKQEPEKKKFKKARNTRNVNVVAIAPRQTAIHDKWITLTPNNNVCFYNFYSYPIDGSYTSTLVVFGYVNRIQKVVYLLPHEAKCFSANPPLTVKQTFMGKYPTWTFIHADMDGNFAENQDFGQLEIV